MTPKSRPLSGVGSRVGSARGSRNKGSPNRRGNASPYQTGGKGVSTLALIRQNSGDIRREVRRIYKSITEGRDAKLTEKGVQACRLANVDPNSIYPKNVSYFVEEQGGDERIGKVHFAHFEKQRSKLILKVGAKLNFQA